jgi:hypothetical protein
MDRDSDVIARELGLWHAALLAWLRPPAWRLPPAGYRLGAERGFAAGRDRRAAAGREATS